MSCLFMSVMFSGAMFSVATLVYVGLYHAFRHYGEAQD